MLICCGRWTEEPPLRNPKILSHLSGVRAHQIRKSTTSCSCFVCISYMHAFLYACIPVPEHIFLETWIFGIVEICLWLMQEFVFREMNRFSHPGQTFCRYNCFQNLCLWNPRYSCCMHVCMCACMHVYIRSYARANQMQHPAVRTLSFCWRQRDRHEDDLTFPKRGFQ